MGAGCVAAGRGLAWWAWSRGGGHTAGTRLVASRVAPGADARSKVQQFAWLRCICGCSTPPHLLHCTAAPALGGQNQTPTTQHPHQACARQPPVSAAQQQCTLRPLACLLRVQAIILAAVPLLLLVLMLGLLLCMATQPGATRQGCWRSGVAAVGGYCSLPPMPAAASRSAPSRRIGDPRPSRGLTLLGGSLHLRNPADGLPAGRADRRQPPGRHNLTGSDRPSAAARHRELRGRHQAEGGAWRTGSREWSGGPRR